MPVSTEELKNYIRSIPDFPKKGILFRDITTLLARPEAFHRAIEELRHRYLPTGIQKIVGIESRGFIFSAPLAYAMGAGLVPIRKKGKLPYQTTSVTYDLEYGQDTLQMHTDAIRPREKVLVVDDLLATGGTARAACQLIEQLQGDVAGLAFLIELTDLRGRQSLQKYDVFSLIQY